MKWNNGKPEEHDSIFAKLYGTDKWRDVMFRKSSNKVLVTIQAHGQRIVDTAYTIDGDWKNDFLKMHKESKVISWMPFPEPGNE